MVSSANQSSRSISPSSPQSATIRLISCLDRGRVAAHHVAAQRLVLQHLLALLGRGVEDDALAEDRRHEGVRRGLVERRVRRPEELLVGLRAGDQHDVAVGEPEPADVAALLAHPLEQADRVDAHLGEVAVAVVGDGVRDLADRRLTVVVIASSTGASGVTSTRFRCTPRGALTIVAIASAIAAGLRKCGCRASPNRTHWLSTSAPASSSQSLPISLQVGPGPHDRRRARRCPRAPSASTCAMPSRPHLPAAYAAMNGRARTATSEETKTMSPRRRSTMPGTNARTSRCAPTMVEVELAGEPLGVDLVDGAGRDGAGVADHAPRCRRGRRSTALAKAVDRLVVGEVERRGRRPRRRPSRICGRDLLAACRYAARRARPGNRPRPGPARSPRRCPTRHR